jgi:predicted Fe-Mo cluster-binding NifX family protein
VVHLHFGRTERFHIVDLDDEDYRVVEARDVDPACRDGSHMAGAFEAVWRVIDDCEAVVVGKIGGPASAFLIDKGVRVFESVGKVDEILGKIIEDKLLDNEGQA